MAELILSPIAKKIVEELGSTAVKEIALLWGVNNELEELEETISTIKAVLLDAEEKKAHNNQVRNWLQRLGGVVDDADNLTDEINTEALRQKVMSGNKMAKQVCAFFSSSNQLAFRFKMGHRIKELKRKLAAISNDRNFLLEDRHEAETQVIRRARDDTYSFVRQEEVIGRDEDRLAIIKLLLESETELQEDVLVIPIVGMGGLGKTTLAQSIFNDKEVQRNFELKIWVCVSENFDLKLIVQKIIKSATNNTSLGDVEMEHLQKELRKVLCGKRYLLILDDMWEESREKWLRLKELLISGEKGSGVVVTTRSQIVAGITAGTMPLYQLGILSEENSWALFKKVAFKQGQEDRKSSGILKIGRDIVKRCGGIPLAIRTIGSLLYSKNSESEWSSFNKEFSKISQQNENDILPTLKLSYDHLASHLKRCFAFCRLFTKDSVIEVKTLVNLWMAQGFLQSSDPSQDQCLEDVGYEYFVNLLERSFFQEAEVDKWGTITTCKMHDLMHDLAILTAGAECAILSLNCEGNIYKNTHHVSFECKSNLAASKIPTLPVQASKIRTLLLLHQGSYVFHESFCDAIISKFKFIRSLDLHGSRIKFVPNSIGKLKHLRYLDLSWNFDLKALPNSITNLVNLQTIKLSDCSELQELPRDIEKLINLRHLEISDCSELNHMPCGLGQLTNLQTLSMYVLTESNKPARRHCGELKELMGLNNLKGELEIKNLRYGKDVEVEYVSANLKEKQYLQSLRLAWDSDIEIDEENATAGYEMSMECLRPHPNLKELTLKNYKGVKLSSWLSSLTNLVNLSFSSCTKCQYLVPLNQFDCLKYLELYKLESLENISNSNGDNSFLPSLLLPSLQQLRLIRLPNLKGWWRDVVDNSLAVNEQNHLLLPYFPLLSKLVVSGCPKLTCMPLYPHLEEELRLEKSSLKPFQDTMVMSPTTSSFAPLSKLTRLCMWEIEDLECLPDWFKSLTSLNLLYIDDCPKLKDLRPGILHLSSLRDLWIHNCEELSEMLNGEEDDDAIMWKALNGRLRSLKLDSVLEGTTVLPKGIQHITSLQTLTVQGCDSLKTIPEWIDKLQSLNSLQFFDCPSLTSLPDGIRDLTSLKSLWLADCPILLKRCKTQIGEDWHKISHIKELYLEPDPNKEDQNLSKQQTVAADKTKTRNFFRKFGLCNTS